MAVASASAAAPSPYLQALRDVSARQIAEHIASGEMSAVVVVERFISRIEAVNGWLNAVTVELFESARAAAFAVDKALTRGERLGPLAGLPVTIKECFDLAGTASTFGLPSRRGLIEAFDDPYVAALRAAGAIPIAKTNVPQLLIATESENPLYGRTNNPWDLERSCGGSSGGEAALIAAGASPLGLGNDIGGSLRIPAAFCGIASIRPTAGRTPDHCGHGLPVGQRGIVSQVGPMARHVEDLVLALVLLDRARNPSIDPGPELGDPWGIDVSKLRFAAFTEDGEFAVAPAARRAVVEAAQILTNAGAELVDWQEPGVSRVSELFFACLSADRGQTLRRLLRGNPVDARVAPLLAMARAPAWLRRIGGFALGALRQRHAETALRRFASGTVEDYWHTIEAIANFRLDLLRSLEQGDGNGPIDIILCPAYPLPALRHGTSRLIPLAGAYAPLANVSGFPAGVVPVTRVRPGEESDRPSSFDRAERAASDTERGSAGLPIAVQVIARPWHDHVALAAMAAIEAEARNQPDYPAHPPL